MLLDPRERENGTGGLPWRQLSPRVGARRGGEEDIPSSGSAGLPTDQARLAAAGALWRCSPPESSWGRGGVTGFCGGCGGGGIGGEQWAEWEGVHCLRGRRGEAIGHCPGCLSEGIYNLKCKRKEVF